MTERTQSPQLKYMRYGLVKHLRFCCDSMPEFQPLADAMGLDKDDYAAKLETVTQLFGTYSRHDISHSNAIIANIEQLLGEERIRCLSPTDTWLILMAAYSHDTAMWVPQKQLNQLWSSFAFYQFIIKQKYAGITEEIRLAASFFLNADDTLKKMDQICFSSSEDESEYAMPFFYKKSRPVRLLLSDYLRKAHAQRVLENMNSDELKRHSHNASIPKRLVLLYALCAAAHGMMREEIKDKLDQRTNGFRNDHAHPRFVAEMIRLGDVLDIDNARFNLYMADASGGMTDDSYAHYLKHESITHLLIDHQTIEIRSDLTDCENPQEKPDKNKSYFQDAFIQTDLWLNEIEEEVKYYNSHWFEIVPHHFQGRAPWLKMREIRYKDIVLRKEDMLLNFSISYSRSFALMQSRSLYASQLSFCRELLQNAIDATKVQFQRDKNLAVRFPYQAGLVSMESQAQKGCTTIELLARAILQLLLEINKYSIGLSIVENKNDDGKDDELYIDFIFSDSGTGIDTKSIDRMKTVGEMQEEKKLKEVSEMPGWLRPTGEFGIGLHSAFIVADQMTIFTLSDDPHFKATIHLQSNRLGGRIIIDPYGINSNKTSLERSTRGTTIKVCANKESILHAIASSPAKCFMVPFEQAAMQILEIVEKMMVPVFFPLRLQAIKGDQVIQQRNLPSLFGGLLKKLQKEMNLSTFTEGELDWGAKREYLLKCVQEKLTELKECSSIIWENDEQNDDNDAYSKYGYYVFLLDFEFPMQNSDKNLILCINFMDLDYRYNTQLKLFFKGACVEKGYEQIVLPFVCADVHVLGRTAKQTMTISRDYLLPEALPSIIDDVWVAMNTLVLHIAHKYLKEASRDLNFLENKFGRGRTVLALYLYRLLWEQRHKMIIEDINCVESLIGFLADSLKGDKIFGYLISEEALLLEAIETVQYLRAPLTFFYTRANDRIYGNTTFLDKPISREIRIKTYCICEDILAEFSANLSLAKIVALHFPRNELKYIVQYEVGRRKTTQISDDELVTLLRDPRCRRWDGGRPEWCYVPAIEQFEVLAIDFADSVGHKEWHYCHAFMLIPYENDEYVSELRNYVKIGNDEFGQKHTNNSSMNEYCNEHETAKSLNDIESITYRNECCKRLNILQLSTLNGYSDTEKQKLFVTYKVEEKSVEMLQIAMINDHEFYRLYGSFIEITYQHQINKFLHGREAIRDAYKRLITLMLNSD